MKDNEYMNGELTDSEDIIRPVSEGSDVTEATDGPQTQNTESADTATDTEDITTAVDEEAEDAPIDDGDIEDAESESSEDIAEDSPDEETEVTTEEYSACTPNIPEEKPAAEEEKPKRVDSLFDFIELFVFTLAAVFIITTFFFKYSVVSGASMEDTLHNGDGLLLYSFLYSPEQGDVIVVQDNSTALNKPIVKRVIATEGQIVEVTRERITVDGESADGAYVYTGPYDRINGGGIYDYDVNLSDDLRATSIVLQEIPGESYKIMIPEGRIFVLGDHRNVSQDSRAVGTLHEDAVIGKVILRLLPFSSFGKLEE